MAVQRSLAGTVHAVEAGFAAVASDGLTRTARTAVATKDARARAGPRLCMFRKPRSGPPGSQAFGLGPSASQLDALPPQPGARGNDDHPHESGDQREVE